LCMLTFMNELPLFLFVQQGKEGEKERRFTGFHAI
jgi:hypothetical protein